MTAADEDLLPGAYEADRAGRYRWVPTPTMTRRAAICAILGMVDLTDEAGAEEALMALGVEPMELLFAAGPALSGPRGTVTP